MANRLRLTAVITFAMIILATLGSGAAVATMLPGRLALWDIPRVASKPLTRPTAPLPRPPAGAPLPTSSGLSAALAGMLSSGKLGAQTGLEITDPSSGAVLYDDGAATMLQPASTAKLATAVAALDVLGPSGRLSTRVLSGAQRGSIVLAGGGDPTLAAGQPPATDYPQPATLVSLAAATARALRAQGRTAVRLSYSTALFSGPAMGPGWTPDYVSTGNVTPISALEVDQGRLTTSGAPQDADNPGNFQPRTFTPASDAAQSFASFLIRQGILVSGPVTQVAAPPSGATQLAAVSSPPVSAMVAWMLRESNNVIAENLARQVALREGDPATFHGAASAVTSVLAKLGISGGIHLVDGSGLSPQDRIAPATLARLVGLAAGPAHPQLRAAITGLPVAGFSGTLAAGQSVFGGFGVAADGVVQAKTGNLSNVATLAGLVSDASGRVLAFAFMTNGVPAASLAQAADEIDQMATALAGCGCGGR